MSRTVSSSAAHLLHRIARLAVLACLGTLGMSRASLASVIFAPPVNYDTGRECRSVALGDLNGDGVLDIAFTIDLEERIGTMLGNGDGTFHTLRKFEARPGPVSLRLAELSGDGKLDAVIANYRSGSIQVFLGNGDGSFGFPELYAAADPAWPVTLGDVNLDGAIDIATISPGANRVHIQLGSGDGTFGLFDPYETGAGPNWATIGDVNGDMNPDIITANFVDHSISVLLGNGDGTFAARTDFATGQGAISVEMGDLDGDGDLDLIVGGDRNINVHLNDGDGSFASRVEHVMPAFYISLAIADLDGDGTLDVALPDYSYSTVSVLLGVGDGTLGPATTYPTAEACETVAAGDLDGDGRLDLVFSSLDSKVSVLLNLGNNASPDCGAVAGIGDLWPPKHQLVEVAVTGITDPDGDPVTIHVTRVTQDEPIAGKVKDESFAAEEAPAEIASLASADDEREDERIDRRKEEKSKCPDAVIGTNGRVQLRAERSGKGNGRVYTIWFTASDGRGGSCDGSVQVCVPQSQHHMGCVDDGQSFNSLGSCGKHGHQVDLEDRSNVVTLTTELQNDGVETLQYSLPAASPVLLAVYDIAGRRVATLEDSPRSAGAHRVTWTTSGLARGMYFCRLQAGRTVVTKPVMVVR